MTAEIPPFKRLRFERYLYPAFLGVLLLAAGIFLVVSWQRLDLPFQIDYGEGPLLDRAVSIRKGESLKAIYSIPQDYPYRIVNYPPLFFLIVSLFIDPQNPLYTPGRVVSLVSVLIVAVNIFFIVKKLLDNRQAAVISGLVLLANPIIAFWTPYFRVDFLGLAFATTGLTTLLYWHQTAPGLIFSVILIVAAAYTRQTYIVCGPLAGFVYLLPRSPRRAGVFAGLLAALGLSILLLLNANTSSGFWFHVGQIYLSGGTPVSWSILFIDKWARSLLEAGPIFPILLLIFFWRYAKDQRFITAYTLGSFVSLLAMIKAGSNYNYIIELVIAFSMIVGVFVDHAMRGGFTRWQQNLFFGSLILQAFYGIGFTASSYWVSDEEAANFTKEWSYLVQEMVKADGQVLTDVEMGVLTQQGYQILFEPFDFSQMARKGLWDQRRIVQDIQQQKFGLIVIQKLPASIIRERWTDEMLAAFDTYYVERNSLPWCSIYYPRSTIAQHLPEPKR